MARAAAALLALVALTGCSSTPDAAAACPAPAPAPAAQTALLPDGLSFEQVGTVTGVQRDEGHLTVRAVTTRPLSEATVLVQDAVTAAGYRPAGMDDEGFEAEVFFTAGTYAAGQAVLRQGACEGRWDVELVLVDPDLVPAVLTSGQVTRPRRKPRATAWARSFTPSLRNRRRAWVLMVSSDR